MTRKFSKARKHVFCNIMPGPFVTRTTARPWHQETFRYDGDSGVCVGGVIVREDYTVTRVGGSGIEDNCCLPPCLPSVHPFRPSPRA
jgi:hypothetical protein